MAGDKYDITILLADNKAKLLKNVSSQEKLKGLKFTRYWDKIPSKYIDEIDVVVRARTTETNPYADLREYPGTYAITDVQHGRDSDGGGILYEMLSLVHAITSVADLAALTPLITRENEILEPFALKTGEEDTVAYIFKNLNPTSRAAVFVISDADLVTNLPGTGWSYVDRLWKDEDDNTATLTILFKKIAWNAFAVGSPDLTWDDNDSTHHERRTELWFKVTNDDALANLYTATDGFNVMSVTISERGDGAVNVQRVQLEEAKGASGTELEAHQDEKINPHAIQSGDMERFTIINEALKDKSTTYATPSAVDYTLIDTKEEFRPDGLWNKYYVYEKPIWLAWGHDTYTVDIKETSLFGDVHEKRKKLWEGIQKDDVQTALDDAKNDAGNVAEAGFHATGVSASDNRDGSVSIQQSLTRMFTWGHDTYAHDSIEYDNAGTANEKEQITKTWFNIDYTNLATAVDETRAGTGATVTAGYIITSSGVRDNKDGTIDVVQIQKKQVNNKDVGNATTPGANYINPHGLVDEVGLNEFIETHYERFTADGLASAILGEELPSEYTLVSKSPTMDGDGLYSIVYRYEKDTFLNLNNGAVKTWRVTGNENTEPDSVGVTRYGIGATKTEVGVGVPIASLESAKDIITAESGYAITAISATDNGNGSGTITKRQTKQRAIADGNQFVTRWRSANGTSEETEGVDWFDVSETNADLIVADAKSATPTMASATYSAAPAGHLLKSIDKTPTNGIDSAGKQLFNVHRVTYIPKITWSYSGGTKNADGTITGWKYYSERFKNSNGVGYNSVAKIVRVDRLITNAIATAKTFSNGSSLHPVTGALMGYIDYRDQYARWFAYRVQVQDNATYTFTGATFTN